MIYFGTKTRVISTLYLSFIHTTEFVYTATLSMSFVLYVFTVCGSACGWMVGNVLFKYQNGIAYIEMIEIILGHKCLDLIMGNRDNNIMACVYEAIMLYY